MYRFEGVSDPGDEAIVLGVRCPACGGRVCLMPRFSPGSLTAGARDRHGLPAPLGDEIGHGPDEVDLERRAAGPPITLARHEAIEMDAGGLVRRVEHASRIPAELPGPTPYRPDQGRGFCTTGERLGPARAPRTLSPRTLSRTRRSSGARRSLACRSARRAGEATVWRVSRRQVPRCERASGMTADHSHSCRHGTGPSADWFKD